MCTVSFGIQLFLNIFDILCVIYYFQNIWEKKRIKNKNYILLCVFYLIIITKINTEFENNWINVIVTTIGTIVLAGCYSKKVTEIFIQSGFYLVLAMIAETISFILFHGNETMVYQNKTLYYIKLVFLSKFIQMLLLFLLIQFKKKGSGHLPIRVYLLLIVVTILNMVSVICFVDTMIQQKIKSVCIIVLIGILFGNFMLYVLFQWLNFVYEKICETKLLENEIKQKEQYFEQIEKQQEEIREIRHNLKNELLVLKTDLKQRTEFDDGDGNEEKLIENLLQKIEKEYVYTHNKMINAIVSDKAKQAEKKEILFESDIIISHTLEKTSGDMGIILGNLLDNAIEAEENLKKTDRKTELYIKLKMRQKKNMVLLVLENALCDEMSANGIKTWKKDQKNHGIGLKSVQKRVDQIGGNMEVEITKQYFKVTVLF